MDAPLAAGNFRQTVRECGSAHRRKPALYARAAFAEYWVLDVAGRRLIVHRSPESGAFTSVAAYSENEILSPLAAPKANFIPPKSSDRRRSGPAPGAILSPLRSRLTPVERSRMRGSVPDQSGESRLSGRVTKGPRQRGGGSSAIGPPASKMSLLTACWTNQDTLDATNGAWLQPG
jgi:hypothetical protein